MKKNWQAILSASLAATLLFSLAACGGKTGTTTKPSGTTEPGGTAAPNTIDVSSVDMTGTNPKMKEKTTLDILLRTDTNIPDFETNSYTKLLEEGTNTDLNFTYLPAGDDGKQKLSIMISTNEKLGDMVIYPLTPLETYSYGSQGFFLALNDYVDQAGKYTKDYFASEEGQSIMKYLKSPDGNIYAIPRIAQEVGNDWDHRQWINKTWLDKLGLEMPTTTDEYADVLRAFRDQDPNGNGKQDEIPLVGNVPGWNQNVWRTIMYSFTFVNDYFEYLQVEDGKLQLSYAQDGWRKGLEYMNMLYEEGLLSPLTLTQDLAAFKQLIEDPEAQLVGSMTAGSMSVYQVASKRKEDMTHMPPLTGPDGIAYTSYRATTLPAPYGFISKDSDTPVAAMVVYDYMYKPEIAMQARFGIKDVDWKEPGADAVGLYEDMGYEPLIEYINSIWGTVQNQHWSEEHPSLRTYAMSNGQVYNGNPYDSQAMTAFAAPDYIGKVPDEIVLRQVYTAEEADEIAEIVASLNKYRDENVAAFISGNRSLDEWDDYLAELDSIGMSDFLEVAQVTYDRMKAME